MPGQMTQCGGKLSHARNPPRAASLHEAATSVLAAVCTYAALIVIYVAPIVSALVEPNSQGGRSG